MRILCVIAAGLALSGAAALRGQVEANHDLQAKAQAGDADAQMQLSIDYYLGRGVPRDVSEALRWCRKAAEQGNIKAENNLGSAYDKGEGVTQDYAEAIKWFRKTAEHGNPFGENNLGFYYAVGRGVQEDEVQAAAWYRKAADQGYAAAENNLGLAYYRGEGVQSDYAQAVAWFKKAAQQGYVPAETNLAGAYKMGQGVERDYTQAAIWYQKAADKGDAHAQNQLGSLYDRGDGVAQDYFQAAEWFRKAAEQGNAMAQANLADMYLLGEGVVKDYAQAAAWYEKAAAQGNVYGKVILPALKAKMAATVPDRSGEGIKPQIKPPLSPQAIAKLASDSTVLIVSVDQKNRNALLGSGFVIEPNLIVTNSHVFPDGRVGVVRKIGGDHPLRIEKVVLRDKVNDLVLLSIPYLNLPTLPIDPGEPVIGDTVFAMGNPEGMEGTFSEGLVSALRDSTGLHMIQISAPVSHGSSGGPVFNTDGEVIGISTSALTSGQNLNFAVPAAAIEVLLKKFESLH